MLPLLSRSEDQPATQVAAGAVVTKDSADTWRCPATGDLYRETSNANGETVLVEQTR